MEIKIDTDALSYSNSNMASNTQIIDEMINFHINEIDQFLSRQENKNFIPEYYIIKILAFLLENSEERSLVILAEIRQSYQTLYEYKVNDKVLIYSKNSEFFSKLISNLPKSFKKDNDSNTNSNNINKNFNFFENINEKNIINLNISADFKNKANSINQQNNKFIPFSNTIKNFEIRIDLDKIIIFPADQLLNSLQLMYFYDLNNNDNLNNRNFNRRDSNFNNSPIGQGQNDFNNKLFFLMISIPNILKLYFFYYKKFKFNKWDSFLINSPFFEEAFVISLLFNFIGLKCAINKLAIKNNFDNSIINDINDYIFEIDNLDFIFSNATNSSAKISNNHSENKSRKNSDEKAEVITRDINNNLDYFYSNFLQNNLNNNNKIDIINISEQENKIENMNKDDFSSLDFETKYFNFIIDTTGEGLNNKNKILFFKLLQNEGNIIVNDNINEKNQIDPRDIAFMYNNSISVCFINIIKNLKFNLTHGKMINFTLDLISKMLLISDKKIKGILNKLNIIINNFAEENYMFKIECLTNKEKFYSMFLFDF